MKLYKKTTYIHFMIIDERPKTIIMNVINNGSNKNLGQIAWYGPWRQYVFSPKPSTIYNNRCLKEIEDVLTELNTKHKKKKEPSAK